jgi:mRNA interferase HicA
VKRRDLERHLRAQGARLLREGGNHSFWGFDAERSTAVPRHREIDFRLARKICADLGIPPADRIPVAPPRAGSEATRRVRLGQPCAWRAPTGAPTARGKGLFAGVFESRRAHLRTASYAGSRARDLRPSPRPEAAHSKEPGWAGPLLTRRNLGARRIRLRGEESRRQRISVSYRAVDCERFQGISTSRNPQFGRSP